MKLALGTAQFGLNYGISNQHGQVQVDEVKQILDRAYHGGIRLLDTAPSYGNSESVIQNADSSSNNFKIVTKTPAKEQFNSANIKKTFADSLKRLGKLSLYGLLVHQATDVIEHPEVWCELQAIKKSGQIQKIGISVYDESEIRQVESFEPDIIQCPINLLDQRLVASGILERLHSRGIEIHARSIFLQGLLLMTPETFPFSFGPWKKHFDEYQAFLKASSISALNACVAFVRDLPFVDFMIVGVTTTQELTDITRAYQEKSKSLDFSALAVKDTALLNPALWKTANAR